MTTRDFSRPLALEMEGLEEPMGTCLFCSRELAGLPPPQELVPRTLSFTKFSGAGAGTMEDQERLSGQLKRIKNLMKDGRWRTFQEIHEVTGEPIASISAQLRNLRKLGMGGHQVDRQHLGRGLYEYRLTLNPKEAEAEARAYYFAKNGRGPFSEVPA